MTDYVQQVIDAWNVPGRRPDVHRAWQTRLRHEWPTLANALDQLTRTPPRK